MLGEFCLSGSVRGVWAGSRSQGAHGLRTAGAGKALSSESTLGRVEVSGTLPSNSLDRGSDLSSRILGWLVASFGARLPARIQTIL